MNRRTDNRCGHEPS